MRVCTDAVFAGAHMTDLHPTDQTSTGPNNSAHSGEDKTRSVAKAVTAALGHAAGQPGTVRRNSIDRQARASDPTQPSVGVEALARVATGPVVCRLAVLKLLAAVLRCMVAQLTDPGLSTDVLQKRLKHIRIQEPPDNAHITMDWPTVTLLFPSSVTATGLGGMRGTDTATNNEVALCAGDFFRECVRCAGYHLARGSAVDVQHDIAFSQTVWQQALAKSYGAVLTELGRMHHATSRATHSVRQTTNTSPPGSTSSSHGDIGRLGTAPKYITCPPEGTEPMNKPRIPMLRLPGQQNSNHAKSSGTLSGDSSTVVSSADRFSSAQTLTLLATQEIAAAVKQNQLVFAAAPVQGIATIAATTISAAACISSSIEQYERDVRQRAALVNMSHRDPANVDHREGRVSSGARAIVSEVLSTFQQALDQIPRELLGFSLKELQRARQGNANPAFARTRAFIGMNMYAAAWGVLAELLQVQRWVPVGSEQQLQLRAKILGSATSNHCFDLLKILSTTLLYFGVSAVGNTLHLPLGMAPYLTLLAQCSAAAAALRMAEAGTADTQPASALMTGAVLQAAMVASIRHTKVVEPLLQSCAYRLRIACKFSYTIASPTFVQFLITRSVGSESGRSTAFDSAGAQSWSALAARPQLCTAHLYSTEWGSRGQIDTYRSESMPVDHVDAVTVIMTHLASAVHTFHAASPVEHHQSFLLSTASTLRTIAADIGWSCRQGYSEMMGSLVRMGVLLALDRPSSVYQQRVVSSRDYELYNPVGASGPGGARDEQTLQAVRELLYVLMWGLYVDLTVVIDGEGSRTIRTEESQDTAQGNGGGSRAPQGQEEAVTAPQLPAIVLQPAVPPYRFLPSPILRILTLDAPKLSDQLRPGGGANSRAGLSDIASQWSRGSSFSCESHESLKQRPAAAAEDQMKQASALIPSLSLHVMVADTDGAPVPMISGDTEVIRPSARRATASDADAQQAASALQGVTPRPHADHALTHTSSKALLVSRGSLTLSESHVLDSDNEERPVYEIRMDDSVHSSDLDWGDSDDSDEGGYEIGRFLEELPVVGATPALAVAIGLGKAASEAVSNDGGENSMEIDAGGSKSDDQIDPEQEESIEPGGLALTSPHAVLESSLEEPAAHVSSPSNAPAGADTGAAASDSLLEEAARLLRVSPCSLSGIGGGSSQLPVQPSAGPEDTKAGSTTDTTTGGAFETPRPGTDSPAIGHTAATSPGQLTMSPEAGGQSPLCLPGSSRSDASPEDGKPVQVRGRAAHRSPHEPYLTAAPHLRRGRSVGKSLGTNADKFTAGDSLEMTPLRQANRSASVAASDRRPLRVHPTTEARRSRQMRSLSPPRRHFRGDSGAGQPVIPSLRLSSQAQQDRSQAGSRSQMYGMSLRSRLESVESPGITWREALSVVDGNTQRSTGSVQERGDVNGSGSVSVRLLPNGRLTIPLHTPNPGKWLNQLSNKGSVRGSARAFTFNDAELAPMLESSRRSARGGMDSSRAPPTTSRSRRGSATSSVGDSAAHHRVPPRHKQIAPRRSGSPGETGARGSSYRAGTPQMDNQTDGEDAGYDLVTNGSEEEGSRMAGLADVGEFSVLNPDAETHRSNTGRTAGGTSVHEGQPHRSAEPMPAAQRTSRRRLSLGGLGRSSSSKVLPVDGPGAVADDIGGVQGPDIPRTVNRPLQERSSEPGTSRTATSNGVLHIQVSTEGYKLRPMMAGDGSTPPWESPVPSTNGMTARSALSEVTVGGITSHQVFSPLDLEASLLPPMCLPPHSVSVAAAGVLASLMAVLDTSGATLDNKLAPIQCSNDEEAPGSMLMGLLEDFFTTPAAQPVAEFLLSQLPAMASGVVRVLRLLSEHCSSVAHIRTGDRIGHGGYADVLTIEPPPSSGTQTSRDEYDEYQFRREGQDGGAVQRRPFEDTSWATTRAYSRLVLKRATVSSSMRRVHIINRMSSEIAVLEDLKHLPHIVGVEGYGKMEGGYGVLLERCDLSLRQWRDAMDAGPSSPPLSSGRLPAAGSDTNRSDAVAQQLSPDDWGFLMLIFFTVTHALDRLHASGVIHFDLKCDNVLIRDYAALEAIRQEWRSFQTQAPEDRDASTCKAKLLEWSQRMQQLICLCDFGESLYAPDEHASSLRTPESRGTDCIKSPEMLALGGLSTQSLMERGLDRRKPVGAGSSSDIWSLGCLLFELLTGSFLFDAQDFSAFYVRVTNNSTSPAMRT